MITLSVSYLRPMASKSVSGYDELVVLILSLRTNAS